MISPTACGALFSARTTPQPLAEPRGTWNLTSGPGPRSLSGLRPQSFSAGKKNQTKPKPWLKPWSSSLVQMSFFPFSSGQGILSCKREQAQPNAQRPVISNLELVRKTQFVGHFKGSELGAFRAGFGYSHLPPTRPGFWIGLGGGGL